MSGFATALDYVLAGLGEHDDAHAARTMMAALGLDPAADPALCLAARRDGRRWRGSSLPSPKSCSSTSRPTTST